MDRYFTVEDIHERLPQKRCCVLLVIVQMQIRTIEVVKLTVFAMAILPHMKWDLKSSAQLVGMIKSQVWKAT